MRPLVWCVLQLALQGALATLYLKMRFDGSKAAPAMHAAVVLVATTLVLVAFMAGASTMPSTRRRIAFALAFGALQAVLLLFHGLTLLAYTHWQAPFALELVGAYAPHVPTLLRVAGVAPAEALIGLLAVLAAIIALYYRASAHVLSGLAVVVASSGAPPTRGVRRVLMCMLAVAVAIAIVYVPTRGLWRTREPLHIAFNSDWSQGQLAPVSMFVNYSAGRHETLSATPTAAAIRPRTLVLVMVDALRSDRMHVYGAARETTPFLSSLMEAGRLQRVDRAYSVCTVSFCGILGTLASKYWHQLDRPPVTLMDVLATHGYQSRLVLGGDHGRFSILNALYGEHIDDYVDGSDLGGYPNDDAALLARLRDSPPPSAAPLFLYAHLMSVHALGTRGDAFRRWQPDSVSLVDGWRRPDAQRVAYQNRYDNGILQADAMIRQLFEWLRAVNRLDDALVVITADHGELLGEGGRFAHGGDPVEAMVRVPLLVYDGTGAFRPARALASQVDIAPTLLTSIGAAVPSGFAGLPLQAAQPDRAVIIGTREVSAVAQVRRGIPLKHVERLGRAGPQLFRLDQLRPEAVDLISDPAYRADADALALLHPPRP